MKAPQDSSDVATQAEYLPGDKSCAILWGELLITEAHWRAGCPLAWLWQWPCRRDNISIALRCSSHFPGSLGAACSAASSRARGLDSIGESPVSPQSPLRPLNTLPTCHPNVISVCLPTPDCCTGNPISSVRQSSCLSIFYFPVFLKGINKYFHKCSLAFSSLKIFEPSLHLIFLSYIEFCTSEKLVHNILKAIFNV